MHNNIEQIEFDYDNPEPGDIRDRIQEIQLEVPFVPVSANSSYRAYKGRVIKSKKLREYEKRMKIITSSIDVKIEGNVRIDVEVRFRDRRKRDIDNVLKTLIDNLKHRLFGDDSKIYELHVKKVVGAEEEKTLVKIVTI